MKVAGCTAHHAVRTKQALVLKTASFQNPDGANIGIERRRLNPNEPQLGECPFRYGRAHCARNTSTPMRRREIVSDFRHAVDIGNRVKTYRADQAVVGIIDDRESPDRRRDGRFNSVEHRCQVMLAVQVPASVLNHLRDG